MNTIGFFKKKYVLKNEKILMFFWKGNKMKGVNNDALLSGRDRHTTKNYVLN